ncbi:uncharacterized protein LOC124283294 [Haliotis rubra]|uniref:uncharacterized protein LOC124283294 n=1 Tax=Haliotis rubra TaxID=36100 RepID=UPI001EE54BC5|nr:uncharacterized protein LOC124283294 [Haliotis rubra]XP_046575280.1 uncharacterized protein LOC124283294 [Haliotis rubra]
MGNIEAHDFAPVRADERKELNLSKKISYKQFCKHLKGEAHESMLTELPWGIRDSVSLYEKMNVSFNAISELPPELPLRLPHLSHIDLSYNRLQTLPESFGLLFHLRTLLLSNNVLRSLPESFVHLVKLECIDLSHNQLKELPDEMGNMEALSKLNVSNNKLKLLPLSLGASKTLTLLIANGNKLESPPQAICSEGSKETLHFLRKLYKVSIIDVPKRPSTPLNVFPRVRGNQLQSSVINPHSAQIQYIQEQTDTTNTPMRIKTPLLPPYGASELDAFQLRDRIIGVIYGAAIGDAIGVATRWMSPDECDFYYSKDSISYMDIVHDEHRVRWRKGDWTSNFDVFMLVMESVLSWGGVVDELDFAKKLRDWSKKGFPELGDSEGVVLSETVQKILKHKAFVEDPHGTAVRILTEELPVENGFDFSDTESLFDEDVWKQQPPRQANPDLRSFSTASVSVCDHFGTDNGAIIRTAILGVPFFHNLGEVTENAVRICRATHSDSRCVASCVVISVVIAMLLQGRQLEPKDILAQASKCGLQYLSDDELRDEMMTQINISDIGSLKTNESNRMSHTYKPLAAAMLALHTQDSYREFVMKLIHEAGDSNSNTCVAGAVLGGRVGYSHLPADWIQGLRKKQTNWLNTKINALLDMMGIP